MIDLSWIIGHEFAMLRRGDFDWQFIFSEDVRLIVACPWRLLESGRVRVSCDDDGQKFGLPAPIDSASEVARLLSGAAVRAIAVRPGTLDLSISFKERRVLEVLPLSSGYEAWQVVRPVDGSHVIACGGGELAHWMHRKDVR